MEWSEVILTKWFWLILASTLLYFFFYRKYTYWSSRGIDGPRPIPIFGNITQRIIRPVNVFELEWMQKYGKIYGLYYCFEPILTVMEPALIRKVLISDFPTFVNRRPVRTFHSVWNKNLFLIEGDEWKRIRALTTPSFTSAKLKTMHHLMLACVDKLDDYFEKITNNNCKKSGPIDAREVFSGFTIDVIASTSFATQTNANSTENRKNEFVVQGLDLFRLPPLNIMGVLAFPRWVNDLIGIRSFFRDETIEWFVALARKIVRERMVNKNQAEYNDLVQLLIEATVDEMDLKKSGYDHLTANVHNHKDINGIPEGNNTKFPNSNQRSLTEDEIVAQCIVYFIAGFETAASTLSFCIYELTKSKETQERLFDEITSKLSKIKDRGSNQYFETILSQMPYLESVIKETLRLYPPLIRLERRVGADHYQLGPVELFKDQVVEVPVYAIHHCAEFFPEPECFRPERFLPENKANIVPHTYLPFGIGPRNCVGTLFAYQEIKICLAEILSKYRFETNEHTPDKLKFRIGTTMLNVNSIPVNIRVRV